MIRQFEMWLRDLTYPLVERAGVPGMIALGIFFPLFAIAFISNIPAQRAMARERGTILLRCGWTPDRVSYLGFGCVFLLCTGFPFWLAYREGFDLFPGLAPIWVPVLWLALVFISESLGDFMICENGVYQRSLMPGQDSLVRWEEIESWRRGDPNPKFFSAGWDIKLKLRPLWKRGPWTRGGRVVVERPCRIPKRDLEAACVLIEARLGEPVDQKRRRSGETFNRPIP